MNDLLKLIREINEAGWQVSTFNQFIESDMWLASVRKVGSYPSGFAQSVDPYAALAQAWVTRRDPLPDRIPVTSIKTVLPGRKTAAPERIKIRR